jgi:hypothetical protein
VVVDFSLEKWRSGAKNLAGKVLYPVTLGFHGPDESTVDGKAMGGIHGC